tara:strand:- start:2125 stop:2292 length:168 start_codon:yes stop_codon:yes gene_type:complete
MKKGGFPKVWAEGYNFIFKFSLIYQFITDARNFRYKKNRFKRKLIYELPEKPFKS